MLNQNIIFKSKCYIKNPQTRCFYKVWSMLQFTNPIQLCVDCSVVVQVPLATLALSSHDGSCNHCLYLCRIHLAKSTRSSKPLSHQHQAYRSADHRLPTKKLFCSSQCTSSCDLFKLIPPWHCSIYLRVPHLTISI